MQQQSDGSFVKVSQSPEREEMDVLCHGAWQKDHSVCGAQSSIRLSGAETVFGVTLWTRCHIQLMRRMPTRRALQAVK